MQPQLVRLSGQRLQKKARDAVLIFQQPDDRAGIDLAGDDLHAEERLSLLNAIFHHPDGFSWIRPTGRERLVGLLDFSLQPEPGVVATRLLVDREEDNPRSFTINTVERRQISEAGPPAQTGEETLLNIATGRNNREKMRFVGDEKLVILIKNRLDKGDAGFTFHFPEIEKLRVREITALRCQRRSRHVQNLAGGQALRPDLLGNMWEPVAEKFEERRVGLCDLRQGDDGGVR